MPGLRRKMRKRIAVEAESRNYAKNIRAKTIALSQKAEKIEILCCGSSHADYGFCPSAFPQNAFNFGSASQDLRTSAALVEKFSKKIPNLKHVVLFFSVFSPGFYLAKTNEAFRSVVFEQILDIPTPEDSCLSEREKKCILNNLRKETGVDPQVDEFGFKDSMPGFNVSAEERTRTHLRENLRKPDYIRYVEEIVSGFKSNVLVVIPPARADYRALLPKKEKLFASLFELRNSRNNFRIADHFEDCDFSDDDFADTDHLNKNGAFKLSRKILGFLNEIQTHRFTR